MTAFAIFLHLALIVHIATNLEIRLIYKNDYETLLASFAWMVLPELEEEQGDFLEEATLEEALERSLIIILFIPLFAVSAKGMYNDYLKAKEESLLALFLGQWIKEEIEEHGEVNMNNLMTKWRSVR